MSFVVRVDDIGWSSAETATPPIKQTDTGLRIAQRFHEAMGGVPYLAGVIPAIVNNGGLAWLMSRPAGMTMALHGWDHGAGTPQERDEFSGLTSQQMRELIDRGQRVLGPGIRHFIPPYNAMAGRLAEAIWHEGIRYIWGRESDWPAPPQPHQIGRAWFLPAWAPLYGASRWRQGTCQHDEGLVGWLKQWGWQHAPAVLTLHVPWEHARDPEFRGVRELAEILRGVAVAPDQFVEAVCK